MQESKKTWKRAKTKNSLYVKKNNCKNDKNRCKQK